MEATLLNPAQPTALEHIPQSLAFLFQKVEDISGKLQTTLAAAQSKDDEKPVTINEVCTMLGKKKPTIYKMVEEKEIPAYKRGNTLYFFESELLEWVRAGRIKTNYEISQEAANHTRNRRHIA